MFQPGSEANKLMASPFKFKRHGQCGMELSEVAHRTRSPSPTIFASSARWYTEHNNHTEGAGDVPDRQDLSAAGRRWGPGSAMLWEPKIRTCPAYIVLRDPEGYNTSGTLLWDNGWLPALYRGNRIQLTGHAGARPEPARFPCPRALQQRQSGFSG